MVIKILPSGDVTTLYRDTVRTLLDSLGCLAIERASNVEFNAGLWYVVGEDGELLVTEGFVYRDAAISAEISFLENSL